MNTTETKRIDETPVYTVHFQKYPYPGPRAAIDRFARILKGTSGVVRLLGDPSGFEADIDKLRAAGIVISDETSHTPRQEESTTEKTCQRVHN